MTTSEAVPLTAAEGGTGSIADQLAAVEPIVRGVCRSRLGATDGDDAAQRTLLALWRRLEAGHRIESLPAYAAVCARYEALSSMREFVDRPTVAVGDLTEWAWADTEPGPEAQAVRAAEVAEATARVEELLSGLTPRQAQAVRATKLTDQDDTDAAAAELGIAASSVRSNLVRAMARLRETCGTRSPNPLAQPGTPYQRARERASAARAAGGTDLVLPVRSRPMPDDPRVSGAEREPDPAADLDLVGDLSMNGASS